MKIFDKKSSKCTVIELSISQSLISVITNHYIYLKHRIFAKCILSVKILITTVLHNETLVASYLFDWTAVDSLCSTGNIDTSSVCTSVNSTRKCVSMSTTHINNPLWNPQCVCSGVLHVIVCLEWPSSFVLWFNTAKLSRNIMNQW